jgi:gliotoxin/aspirochlorine biosynthesis peptide synthetase
MDLISSWSSPSRKIYNCYGPSETTCSSLIAEVLPGALITLGLPMLNSDILLFNEALEPCEEGEIWISGPGLATGYLNDVVLTRSKFIYHNGTRFYRTGDYAKRQLGELIFLGRGDSMIKNRGFLVNIETEIIPAILTQDGVESATAFLTGSNLIAFVTPDTCQPNRIRVGMFQRFDSFLIPDYVYCLDKFPLTPNGKTDVHALRKKVPKSANLQSSIRDPSPTNLAILKSVVAQSLGLGAASFDEKASFWSLGGNSLSAIQVLSKLRSYNLTVSMSGLLGHDDLESLSLAMTSCQFLEPNGNPMASVEITPTQERLLSTLSRNPLYNYIVLDLEIPGGLSGLQEERFRVSWEKLLKRHSIFASSFDLGKRKLQKVDNPKLDWQKIETTKDNWETEYCRQMHYVISCMQSSESSNPETVFRLITATNYKARLLWLVHHSRTDGYSVKIIFEELQSILDERTLAEAPQFSEAATIQKRIEDTSEGKAESFWEKIMEIQSSAKLLDLPSRSVAMNTFDKEHESSTYLGLSVSSVLDICRQFEVAASSVFYGAWALLLTHYNGSNTASFGAVFSGRNLPMSGADRVVGPMINVCPFPVHIREDQRKPEWLRDIQSQLNQMSDMQWSSDRYTSQGARNERPILFDTLISLQFDTLEPEWRCEAIPTPWKLNQTQISEFPWTLLVEIEDQAFKLRLLYQPSAATLALTTRALRHFKKILLALLDSHTDVPVPALAREKLLTASEVDTLIQRGQEPAALPRNHTSIIAAFESAVHNYASLVAIESASRSLTYQELNTSATALAQELFPNASSGRTVAILADGSTNWVISILAVLKTGAVYCPIDISHPKERVQKMLHLCSAAVLIAPDAQYLDSIETIEGCRTVIVQDGLESQSFPTGPPPVETTLEDPAYLIFTSGTTGSPKGVRATNRGLLSYISYPPARLHAAPGRRIAQMFSVGFDACAAEIFGTLCYGGTLLLKHPTNIFAHLRAADAAMMTPSFLSACSPDDFPDLHTIVLGGEVVPQQLADAWSVGRSLYNGYGPCECTVGSVFAKLSPRSLVTLGGPIPGMSAYILNENRALVPIGITGEIYLSGDQVTGGYFFSEPKDRDRFLPDPWRPGQTMFRTGDLGRWTESMEIEYLGRLDRQVKLRGFRVNLEEVESVIRRSSPSASQAAVIASNGNLVAFISPTSVDEDAVRGKIRPLLPYFSIPSRFEKLSALPLSTNQKVDYRALENLALANLKRGQTIVPLTGLAWLIADVWKEVLQNKSPGINLNDDFISLGGHSILQLELVRRLSERLKCKIPLETIMSNSALLDQADALFKVLERSPTLRLGTTPFITWKGNAAPENVISTSEEEMVLLSSRYMIKSTFNMPCLFQIKGALDITQLSSAIRRVLLKNRVLRSRYRYDNGKVSRHISDSASLLEIRSGKELEMGELESVINRSFDFENDQLLRLVLFQMDATNHYLLVVAHHSVMDGTSLALFFQSLQDCYTWSGEEPRPISECKGSAMEPPRIKQHFSQEMDYFDWLNWRASVSGTQVEYAFWREYLGNPPAPFLKPVDASSFNNTGGLSSHIIPPRIAQAMASACAQHRVSEQQLVLAAIVLTVGVTHNIKDLIIAIPFSHRDEPGSESVLGLLLDRLPIRLHLDHKPLSHNELLAAVRVSMQRAIEHAMPYSDILHALSRSSSDPLFELMVSVHQHAGFPAFKIPGCAVSPHRRLRAQGAKFPCMFELWPLEDGGILCEVEYMIGRIDAGRVNVMAGVFEKALEMLCGESDPAGKYESWDEIGHDVEAIRGKLVSLFNADEGGMMYTSKAG